MRIGWRVIAAVVALMAFLPVSSRAVAQMQAKANEQTVWKLEHAYWSYVQENDLRDYLDLWHKDFLGWPSVSIAPVHKDHITDWITAQTSKGLRFKTVAFKPAAIQVDGDVALTYYWLTYQWLDKHGNGAKHTMRVTHTLLWNGRGWHIIGGMSMPEDANQRE